MNFDDLLVATKFAPPRIGTRFIARKQLLGHLRNTQESAVTLISGSAGFGKTILLVQWRQELMKSGGEVSWLSLSQEDRRLPTFCAYLFAALRRLGIPIDNDVLQESSKANSMDTVVALVTSEAEKIAKELWLFIDDYHHVEDPWANSLMQKMLDHCPPNLHFVIASRVLPPLSLSRLRLLGLVAEIGSAELPFDMEETRLFFEQNLATFKLSTDELQLVHDLTNGWPASLQLIAIMLRNRPPAREKLHSLLARSTDLQTYLAEDVIAHLPQELLAFMQTLSVCRRFNSELAAHVTETANAAALLKRAEDENLLIYRIDSDDRSPWYRFHPLFGEFLVRQLRSSQGEAVYEALQRRASQWFGAHGFLIESVRHAYLGNDIDSAVKTIEEVAPSSWTLSYISPMLHLLDRLPQKTLFAHPKIFFLGCLTYALTARPDQAERWISELRKSDAAKIPAISSKFAIADAAVALQRDDTKRVIDLLEPLQQVAPDHRFLHHVYLSALSAAYVSVGRFADARKLLNENPITREDRAQEMGVIVESQLLLIALMSGNVKEAERMGSALLAYAETTHGRGSVSAQLNAANMSDVFYEIDRREDARKVLANRAGMLRSSTPEAMIRASLSHARLSLLEDSADEALQFLQRQAAHFHSLALDRAYAYMLAEQVKILLARGNAPLAEDKLQVLVGLMKQYANAKGFVAEIPLLVLLSQARCALQACNAQLALDFLDQTRARAESLGRERMLVTVNLLSAMAHQDLRASAKASDNMLAALQAGGRLGLMRTFLDEGTRLGARQAVEKG